MISNRRTFLTATTALLAASAASRAASAQMAKVPIRKIATEEAFATPELAKAWLEIARSEPAASLDNPTGIFSIFDNPRPGSNQDRFRRQLLDVDAERIRDMDEANVDIQLLSVTIPGVQIFEPARRVRSRLRPTITSPPPSPVIRPASWALPALHRTIRFKPSGRWSVR